MRVEDATQILQSCLHLDYVFIELHFPVQLLSLPIAVLRNLAIEALPETYVHVTLRLATVGRTTHSVQERLAVRAQLSSWILRFASTSEESP